MKFNLYTTVFTVLTVVALATSCNPDKAAKLQELKGKRTELDREIAALQKELNLSDTSASTTKSKEVAVIELSPRPFDHYVQTQGLIQAENNILVSARSMGVLTQVIAKEGDAVSKGQVLAQIDNSIIMRSIDEVKGQLELATTVYQRQKTLWDQKIGSEVQYLQAKNNKESLEKRLATLQEQLEMTKIKSPISGTVDAVNAKVGENVGPGMPAFRVINTSDLKVSLKVSEAYANTISNGNMVSVTVSDLGKTFQSKISFVGRNIDPLSRSFPVEVKLPSTKELHPNMTAVVRVIYDSFPAALVVPVNVVQDINGQKVVYVAVTENGQSVARKKVVEISGVYDNLAHITSGLNAGDKIITVGYQGLNDGQFIRI
jgi:RND family efflux transporter MFP subunit